MITTHARTLADATEKVLTWIDEHLTVESVLDQPVQCL